jgi:hypothetical protein
MGEASATVTRSRRSLSFGIFFTLFFAYLLSSSRERPWADANPVWQVAESLVDHHGVDVTTRWPYNAPTGRKGKYYATNPLLNSLVHLPGAYLRYKALKKWPPRLYPRLAGQSLPFAAHLAPAALAALACVLFFHLCREHGISQRAATLTTLGLGFASTAWVYARYPYSEALQMATFTGALLQAVRVVRQPSTRHALLLGLWAGLLVDTKTVFLVALPCTFIYIAWSLRDWRVVLRVVGWASATFLPLFSLYFIYNWWRWGAVTRDGYGGGVPIDGSALTGLWGLFFSPGKSVFLYSPLLVLALFGVRALLRRAPRTVVLLLASVTPVVLFHARFLFWHGDFAWGPRYLVFAVPALTLPAALVVDEVLQAGAPLRRALLALVCLGCLAAGLVVQVAGNAFYWDHWIRLSAEARGRWLGAVNRGGSIPPDRNGTCGPCFEDLHQLQWLPPFQPIAGHLWLLRHVLHEDGWNVAEADAPWHRYTRLPLDIASSYARARIDWWAADYDRNRRPAKIIGLYLAAGMLLGIVLWVLGSRPVRARRRQRVAELSSA